MGRSRNAGRSWVATVPDRRLTRPRSLAARSAALVVLVVTGMLVAVPVAGAAPTPPTSTPAPDVAPAPSPAPGPATPVPIPTPFVPYTAPPVVIVSQTRLVGTRLLLRTSCPRKTGGCRGTVRVTITGFARSVRLRRMSFRLRDNRRRVLAIRLSARQRRAIRRTRPTSAAHSVVAARSGGGRVFHGRYVTELRRGPAAHHHKHHTKRR